MEKQIATFKDYASSWQTKRVCWKSSKALKLFKPQQATVCNASPCSACKVYTKCRSSIDRRVCFVDIAKTLGVGKGEFPDPRCLESVEMDVIL